MLVMNVQQIMKILPHRYPFLLIDRLEEVEKGVKVFGYKNVTINEPFFQGHFPDHPTMPGVLIVEAMAQVGGAYVTVIDDIGKDSLTYFVGIDKARFRKPVLPGDVLRLEVELMSKRRGIYQFSGKAFVEDTLVAEANLMATFAQK
ncbi:3-hydroxyacyl-ACP dehydratase FabZ [uncultured Desulfuromusa sp.]|uniref:3-hydroxyacyl-ACP dehydratase FabZ n=1 Tax=uncultured Desulfuromusa sp. TaxID=219183 RepID=UPI002AA6DB34|nr:3-hydroxyacyl-ACP dehydratase FabZ [uncultured Desulfuromusa sp.]